MTYLRPALVLTLLFTLLTGLAYPLTMTGLSQALFPSQANGSLFISGDAIIGSSLIGQNFTSEKYFHGRPSAAGKDGYDATASSGSNLAPSSKDLIDAIKKRVADLGGGPAPADLVMASASGLDPDISPQAARAQIPQVAKARGRTEADVEKLVATNTQGPALGFLGEPHVNVLMLNLSLDGVVK